MAKEFLTYAKSGVGAELNKREKTNLIRDVIASVPTSKDKYVLGDFGGFAGCFDLGMYMEEHKIKDKIRQIVKKYSLKTCNYEKRLPYVLAAEWLGNKLNYKK